MGRVLAIFAAFAVLLLPSAARADPADVDAAARGVVRVVVIASDGEQIFPVSHGTGFAVSPNRVLTNAHVVREALEDDALRIGIVPSDGADAVYGQVVSVDSRIDLALIETTGNLRLAPLVIAGGPSPDSGEVTAVGYPMNVDQAQGLEIGDIFRSQPPVKAPGFISGARPSRQFDTLLHTAPIARGNSGGPLLDDCGRVIGVNSFGAEAGGSDAEFFFAVSAREVISFLRRTGTNFAVNALPCRSMAELDAAEQQRIEREQRQLRQRLAQQAATERERLDRARFRAQLDVMTERENHMALAFVLALIAAGLGAYAFRLQRSGADRRKVTICAIFAGILVLAAIIAWLTRPGIDRMDERVAAILAEGDAPSPDSNAAPVSTADRSTSYICRIQTDRSRITGPVPGDVEIEWSNGGCVNSRTQYGFSDGDWRRVLVPADDDAVAVNTFDPEAGTLRIDRYLLSRDRMTDLREVRSSYTAPQCNSAGAAERLGELQGGILAALPSRPNERLVFDCEAMER